MSIDNDTPTKPSTTVPLSLRKRIASKSMHDIKAAAAAFPSLSSRNNSPIPTRTNSISDLSRLAAEQPHSRTIDIPLSSLTIAPSSFGRRSDSGNSSPSKRGGLSSSFTTSRTRSPTAPASFRPTIASTRTLTAPAALPSISTLPDISPLPSPILESSSPIYDEDNLPSPFLKKVDSGRFPSAVPLTSRASIGTTESSRARRTAPNLPIRGAKTSTGSTTGSITGRPSMASRLLATRAQAKVTVDEVGRRISGVSSRNSTITRE